MARKKISPTYFAGGLVLVVAVYMQMTSGAPPRAKSNNRFVGPPSSKKAKEEIFRPEDYTASFPVVALAMKNAFKPLVAKPVTGTQLTPLAPNGIPASFAGGDGNWIYTGNGAIDGVPNALLENTSTGETVFLSPGQRWQKLTLVGVREDRITLLGPGGIERTVQVNDQRNDASGQKNVSAPTGASGPITASNAPALPAAGAAPSGVALSGPIGPTATPQISLQPSRRGGRRGGRLSGAQSAASGSVPGNTP